MLNVPLSRRTLLLAGAGAGLSLGLPRGARRDALAADGTRRLRARPGSAYFRGAPYPATPVWCYDDWEPGPVLRVRQGERLRVVVDNALAQPTTVHRHGVRRPTRARPGFTGAAASRTREWSVPATPTVGPRACRT